MSAPVAATAGLKPWLERFAAQAGVRAGQAESLRQARESAMARFGETGFPTAREEDWRQTSLAQVTRTEWLPAPEAPVSAGEAVLETARLDPDAATALVVINGRFRPELSAPLPEGIRVRDLDSAATDGAIMEILAGDLLPAAHALGHLNLALADGGLVVDVLEGRVVEKPLHVLHLTSGAGEVGSLPRLVIQAAAGSQVEILEHWVGHGRTFTAPVTDIHAAAGAVVAHTTLVETGDGCLQTGLIRARQERDSHLGLISLVVGGALVRNDITVHLAGTGADCAMDGLYLGDGSRHVDHHTTIDHAVPRCTSRQLYKGILDDDSRGVFCGKVLVRADAVKTSAWQTNKNLLLSDGALAHSTPQLEIHTDDVQCRHGSTIGQLDETMLFYLRSRGIAPDAAREVLTYAFASEIFERVKPAAVRRSLERRLGGEA